MDEQSQKPRNPNDLLIFQNIDSEPHEWQYDAIKTPLPYYIGAGETRELPFYIAKHGIEKLIDKILQKQNKIHTSPVFREELRKKIVLGLKHINYIREKTPNEIALEAMQRKKDTDPYEELLKEREIEAEQKALQQAAKDAPAAPLLEVTGQPVVSAPSNTDSPIVAPTMTSMPDVPEADPERINVYNLLTNKLHMDLSHTPTKEKLDSMPVAQLKSEFASELPELANPVAAIVPDAPIAPAAAAPTPTPTPEIPMSPKATAAPILDQQLGL